MKYPIKMGGQSKREEQRTKENMIPFTNQFETYLATLKAYKASFIGKCRSRNFLNQKPVTLLWQVFPVYHLPNPYFPIFQTKRNTLHMFYTLTSCPPTHTHTHTHTHTYISHSITKKHQYHLHVSYRLTISYPKFLCILYTFSISIITCSSNLCRSFLHLTM